MLLPLAIELLEEAIVPVEDATHEVDLLFKTSLELLKCNILVDVLILRVFLCIKLFEDKLIRIAQDSFA